MRIKLAILEKDQSYLSRIVSVFSTKYADKLEIYSFTDPSLALAALDSARIDVFVSNEAFDIDAATIPKRCGFAYLVDSVEVDAVNGQRAICKFQKADLIYKQILSIYSDNSGRAIGLRIGDDHCKVIGFSSVGGGAGASSMAAACALRFASMGKKVLYLNLEKYGSSDAFFEADGQFDMSDIIFSLKSKKANLSLKLESCVKRDNRDVYFYSQSKIALDMLELGKEEILRLISELKLSGMFEYIIVDIDFSLDKDSLDVYRTMNTIALVADGTEVSNLKNFRAYNALATIEQGKDDSFLSRLVLIYNKFSNKTGKSIEGIDINNIGGAPWYMHATTAQVIEQLAAMNMFDKIM